MPVAATGEEFGRELIDPRRVRITLHPGEELERVFACD